LWDVPIAIGIVTCTPMRRLSFFSKLAFICNVCLVLSLLSRYVSFIPKGDFESTVIIDGLVLSFIVNASVCITYGILLLKRKAIRDYVPVWLATINFLFLIFQLVLILIP